MSSHVGLQGSPSLIESKNVQPTEVQWATSLGFRVSSTPSQKNPRFERLQAKQFEFAQFDCDHAIPGKHNTVCTIPQNFEVSCTYF